MSRYRLTKASCEVLALASSDSIPYMASYCPRSQPPRNVRAVSSGDGSGVGVGGTVGGTVAVGAACEGASSGCVAHAVVRSDKADHCKNFRRESFIKPLLAHTNYLNDLFCKL